MPIHISIPEPQKQDENPENFVPFSPKLLVIGVGGGGGNAINTMVENELSGVKFLACNTDRQALQAAKAQNRIALGSETTRGLGAGFDPEVGRAAAEESLAEIRPFLEDADMVFITAGMGGGTGTGAAPVIAEAARECGCLTVGVVTKPFGFEGVTNMAKAETGIELLSVHTDTRILIVNDNVFRVINEKVSMKEMYRVVDSVLFEAVRGITDLVTKRGYINLDFNDVRTVMSEMGNAVMGTGEGTGESRAQYAVEAALENPLLDGISISGAKSILLNISGGDDIGAFEVQAAVEEIRKQLDDNVRFIFGHTIDPELEGKFRVSLIATGMNAIAAANGENTTYTQTATPIRRFTPAVVVGGASANTASAPANSATASPASPVSPVSSPRTATSMSAGGAGAATALALAVEPEPESEPEAEPEPEPETQTKIAEDTKPVAPTVAPVSSVSSVAPVASAEPLPLATEKLGEKLTESANTDELTGDAGKTSAQASPSPAASSASDYVPSAPSPVYPTGHTAVQAYNAYSRSARVSSFWDRVREQRKEMEGILAEKQVSVPPPIHVTPEAKLASGENITESATESVAEGGATQKAEVVRAEFAPEAVIATDAAAKVNVETTEEDTAQASADSDSFTEGEDFRDSESESKSASPSEGEGEHRSASPVASDPVAITPAASTPAASSPAMSNPVESYSPPPPPAPATAAPQPTRALPQTHTPRTEPSLRTPLIEPTSSEAQMRLKITPEESAGLVSKEGDMPKIPSFLLRK
ncbi:MAG: cell division protein FtsZ [Alphaproteobacteria bacterium]